MENKINLLDTRCSLSVITLLRKHFPGRWIYQREVFGGGAWYHESGWNVRKYAALSPHYDGDDDTFVTQYRRSDTGQELFFIGDEIRTL